MKITVPEAARRVGRNPETIRRWIWSGKLPSDKVGTQHLVEEGDLERIAPGRGDSLLAERWQEWVKMVEQANRETPVPSGTFRSLEDVFDEVRGDGR